MEPAIRTAHLVPDESSSLSSATPLPLPKNLEASEGNRRISPGRSLPAEAEPERPIKSRRRTRTTPEAVWDIAVSFFGILIGRCSWLNRWRNVFWGEWGPNTLFFTFIGGVWYSILAVHVTFGPRNCETFLGWIGE